jgi:probable phosphoglycerate mutase
MSVKLLVVRHGRTAQNAAGRLLGRADPPLDDLGERQAAALAAAIGPVDRVVSSPLLRTRQTAAAFGAAVEVDERLVELDYGDWDGRRVGDIAAEEWATWRRDLSFTPPGGESLAALATRVRTACTSITESSPEDATVVAVTHVSPVKAALCWALGVDDATVWRTFVAPASLTRIAVRAGVPQLHSFNETGHLAAVASTP